ncbi:hypothetical protein ColTof4_13557 [Colletotrichum tofieldiae]|nr:hypothetical protein ColTof3_14508 [Colletotrichum tofieldiae]GKT81134.1 hypothetical protein ColTof4_13557 [Colletotrichum tofieldiae]GKT97353.1 hypothetical protein Ct61P_15203 [Colletotrichum tofieldiae]
MDDDPSPARPLEIIDRAKAGDDTVVCKRRCLELQALYRNVSTSKKSHHITLKAELETAKRNCSLSMIAYARQTNPLLPGMDVEFDPKWLVAGRKSLVPLRRMFAMWINKVSASASTPDDQPAPPPPTRLLTQSPVPAEAPQPAETPPPPATARRMHTAPPTSARAWRWLVPNQKLMIVI